MTMWYLDERTRKTACLVIDALLQDVSAELRIADATDCLQQTEAAFPDEIRGEFEETFR